MMRITCGPQSSGELIVYNDKGHNVTDRYADKIINIEVKDGQAVIVTGNRRKPVNLDIQPEG